MVKKLEHEIFENEDIIIDSEGDEAEKQYLSPIEEDIQEQPKKKERKKRVWTDEQKKKLVENLRAGRVKSIATRNKNAKLKRLQQKMKQEEDDTILFNDLTRKNETRKEKQELLDEVLDLKEEINNMKINKNIKLTNKTPPIPDVEDIRHDTPKPTIDYNDFKKLGLF